MDCAYLLTVVSHFIESLTEEAPAAMHHDGCNGGASASLTMILATTAPLVLRNIRAVSHGTIMGSVLLMGDSAYTVAARYIATDDANNYSTYYDGEQ